MELAASCLGAYFGCALDSLNVVTCWGSDTYGQITNTPRTNSFHFIDTGYWRACGLEHDDGIVCWGLPMEPIPEGRFTSVSVGIEHACALRDDETLACWESRAHADGRAVAPGGTFLAVSAGGGHSCGLRTDHGVVCWGENNFGQSDPPPP